MRTPKNKVKILRYIGNILLLFVTILIVIIAAVSVFDYRYSNLVYPNVSIAGIPFGGQTQEQIATFWKNRNQPFATTQFELKFQSTIATISGTDINLGYDADLSAEQAYSVGRGNGWLTDLYTKFFRKNVNLEPYFRWKENVIDDTLNQFSDQVNIPVQDALFRFSNGRVIAFRPSKDGRQLNIMRAKQQIKNAFLSAAKTNQQRLTILLPIETVRPFITTDGSNTFGIKELIGMGYSEFAGSIAGRIHNVALAASRINGILIKPGETFSFDTTLGDISAATGYQSAYIIKEGHTVLGDGGGVCQVSTTLFRAALAAGLPIVERHAHAYRVHYYEEDGSAPGLDATVFSPSVDLKFTNDTPGYILIQAKPDLNNLSLRFDLYGTRDGRISQIYNTKMWGQSSPPPDLYQDDPTLLKGTVKQVDFAAWGAKTSFQYKVTRGSEILQDSTFYSNFQPWQAVYLRGTL
jgi:vancomycin resistance protein YoaR